jgi:hypothetical protein
MKTHEPRRPRRRLIIACLVATLTLAAAACGADDGDGLDGAVDETGPEYSDTNDTPPGEPMNVLDAAAQPEGTRVTVTGVLIEDTGTLFIADALAESFPPQPGGATLEIEDLLIDEFDGVITEGPIQWRDEPATITATLQGGLLTDSTIIRD